MTAASADRDCKRSLGDLIGIPGKTSEVFYKGTIGMLEVATGLLENGADTASMRFAGVLAKAGTGDGTTKFEVYTEGVFLFTYGAGSVTNAMIGTEVCITDNATVDAAGTTTNDIVCGRVVEVPSTSTVRVKIDGYGFGFGA